MHRLLRTTAWAVGLTLLLIALGGVVRVTGAGLACPDWPLCHGRLVPPLEGLVLVEYGHRLLASLVGLLTLLLVVQARRARPAPGIRRAAWAALLLLTVQVLLGGLTVHVRLVPAVVAAHLGTAMLFLAALLVLGAGAYRALRPLERSAPPGFAALVAATGALAFTQILLGGYLSTSGAALACPDFPLCRGSLLPPSGGPVLVHWVHRLGAALLALAAAALAARAREASRPLRRLAALAMLLVIVQIALGALNVLTRVAPAVTVLHLLTAALLFGTLVLLAALTPGAGVEPVSRPRGLAAAAGGPAAAGAGTWRRVVADYVALTKPRIVLLLLATTVAAMVVAAGGWLSPALLVYTLLGGTLAAGAANAINCYWDRDIDAVMARTRRRPLPAGRVAPRRALAFGAVLAVLAVAVLGGLVNWLSAVLALAGLLFYVLVYTMWLKRTTPQNIVIGGAAGAVPPLVGWAAVTGRVEVPALLLFLIVFLWTPPHFWALALQRRQEYAAAGVPMLPVVAGEATTRRQIFAYTVALVAATLLLVPFGGAGGLYLAAAVLLGAGFLRLALAVLREGSARAAGGLFGYSIVYLVLLLAALMVDRLV